MGKRVLRYPTGDQAICMRCGAPSSRMRGGQLLPVKGFRHREGRRKKHLQHSDPAFCHRRIDQPRRTPTSTLLYVPRPEDIR